MRRLAGLLCAGLLLCALTGCAGRFLPETKDIASVELLRTLAVDAGEGERVKVTVSTGVGQGAAGKPKRLTRSAETVSAACQTIQQSGTSAVFFGHVTDCVVGEALAKEGIGPVLDDIQRDFEMRMDTPIFLVRGVTAEELLEKTAGAELAATDQLQEIGRELPLEDRAWPCTVRDILVDRYDNGWSLMPVVRLRREAEGYGVVSDGMALFHGDRLVKRLDAETGRGANLLLDQPQAGYVDVTLPGGVRANLKLTGAACRWRPRWTGKRLAALTAEVSAEADLTELDDPDGVWEERNLRELERELARQVADQVKQALREERTEGDFLHLERRLIVQCPGKVGEIRKNWDRWREELDLRATVNATVRQSYDVSRSSDKAEKEE